jgi:hypothetical protein
MKKLLLGLIFFTYILPVIGQNQTDNLTKYWRYRDRLRNRFIVVNENVENMGVNIPAVEIDYGRNKISWGDGNTNMSHYLSVLATELWLLKNNNQDYSTTLKELYYAMLALERMDLYSEASLRWKANYGYWIHGVWVRTGVVYPDIDINGFHIRDDVSDSFWNNYRSHFDVANFGSVYKGVGDETMEEISQDNIFHNMEGLALIAKLIGTESISGIPANFVNNTIPNRLSSLGIQNGSTINFSMWAQDFVKRYISYMQSSGVLIKYIGIGIITTHWALHNPITNQLVKEGSGSDLDLCAFYHRGVIKTGQAITGQNLRVYDGLGSTDENFYNELFRNHRVELNTDNSPVIKFLFGRIYIDIPFDNYKLSSLSLNENVLGSETFSILRDHRDHYNPMNTGHFPIYEHFPLLYLTLHDPNYNVMAISDNVYTSDQTLYENLLNLAPACGPISNGVYEWSSTSRCVWPEDLGKKASENIEYSGLDYMMLHNLYYIAFRKEDFKTLSITTNYTNQTIGRFGGKVEASNSITGGNVTYLGSNSIVLKPGFTASIGTTFEAKIYQRPNNYNANLFKTIPVLDCKSTLKSTNLYNVTDNNAIHEFFDPTKIVNQNVTIADISIEDESTLSVFPNPNNGIFSISLNNSLLPLNFEIVSVDGIIVYKGTLTMPMEQIDVSNLSKGIYLIYFYDKNKTYTKKLSIN